MPRIDLQVPFDEKDDAKRLGARWDPGLRVWFVPHGVDPGPCSRWFPEAAEVNVVSDTYFIAESTHDCWRCTRATRVHGFVLPEGHAVLNVGEIAGEDEWEVSDEPTLLCFIDYLTPSVAERMQEISPSFRPATSGIGGAFYWTNFCEHCGAQLDDNEIFCEPGQGFLAFTEEDARRVVLHRVSELFGATCGSYSFGVALYEEMRIK